jgi:hypothetical protein
MKIEESDNDGWFLMQLTNGDLVYLEMGLDFINERTNFDYYNDYRSGGLDFIKQVVKELVDRKLAQPGRLTKEEQEHDYSNLILSVREK